MQRGFAQLFLLLGVLLIAGGVGGYLIVSTREPEQKMVLSVAKDISPGPSSSPNVYFDEADKFSFNVPAGFTIKKETEAEFHKRSNGNIRENFTNYVQYAPGVMVTSLYLVDQTADLSKAPFTIWVFENPDKLSAAQFYNKFWYYPAMWGDFSSDQKNKYAPTAEFIVGSKGSNVTKGYGSAAPYSPGPFTFGYVSVGDKMYLFRVLDHDQKTGQTVLDSFVFSEKTP